MIICVQWSWNMSDCLIESGKILTDLVKKFQKIYKEANIVSCLRKGWSYSRSPVLKIDIHVPKDLFHSCLYIIFHECSSEFSDWHL